MLLFSKINELAGLRLTDSPLNFAGLNYPFYISK
jgi:hypothetical protein